MKKVMATAFMCYSVFISPSASSEIIFPTPHDGGTTTPKLPSNLYLRCGSTSTSVNSQSRLTPFQKPGVYTIVYDVKNADALSRGDNCIFTATSQPDTVGSDSVSFSVSGNFVQAPGYATPKFGGTPAPFTIKYSSLRAYRAILSLTNPPNLMIMPADGRPDGSEPDEGGISLGF